MFKSLPILLAALLVTPVSSFAADTIKIDVYLGGSLKQSVSLAGPNAVAKFSPNGMPNTMIEFRLIAPEPIIIEMKETTNDGSAPEAIGRIKLHAPGSSIAVADIKGNKFHHPYVLTRID
jgi:hypothetical protein